MRILIDCTGITLKKAGVGVYAKNLVEEVIRLAGASVFLLVQDDDPDWAFDNRENVTMLRVPGRIFRKLPLRLLLEQVLLPLLLLRHRIDAVHSMHYSFPLVRFGVKQVVTLHDMTFFNMPEVHLRLKILYFRFFIRASVRFADKLIFVSHSAMSDYVARLGPPRGSAVVIHHGKSDAFHAGLNPGEVQRVRQKYGLCGDFILYVGTIEPRKNLARLVSAFALICDDHPGLLLAIAGSKGWMYEDLLATVRRFNLQSRVIFTGFIPEDEKPFLMSAATAFSYPSLYEGFGIPVLEAMACGIPTVTSNNSSLPEVVGDAALTIDPNSIPELSSALERLISDRALRERLKTKSLRRAALFTWTKAASQTMDAYESVISRKTDPRT